MTALLARYRALPRAVKWLALAAAVILLYFAAVEPAIERTARFNADADKLAASLQRKAQVRDRVADAATHIEQLAGLLGQPALPGDPAERDNALRKRINAIFSEHRVQSQRAVYKDPAAIQAPDDAVAALLAPRQRLERLAVDLTFETDIPTLMAIMQALETAPEVCAITKVSVRKVAPPARSRDREPAPVQVSLTAEAWTAASPAPAATPGRAARSTGGER